MENWSFYATIILEKKTAYMKRFVMKNVEFLLKAKEIVYNFVIKRNFYRRRFADFVTFAQCSFCDFSLVLVGMVDHSTDHSVTTFLFVGLL